MFRGILAALGAGAMVSGLTSTVSAQSIRNSQPKNDFTTLSGDSLRGLESRNLLQDDSSVVNDAESVSETEPISISDINSASAAQPQVRIVLGDILEINLQGPSSNTDSQNQSQTNVVLSNKIKVDTGGSSMDSEQVVRVQYQLREY